MNPQSWLNEEEELGKGVLRKREQQVQKALRWKRGWMVEEWWGWGLEPSGPGIDWDSLSLGPHLATPI